MPRLDGLSLIRELKKRSRIVKIIAVTGEGSESLTDAQAAGASHCFSKPFKVEEVLSTVQEMLG